MLRFMTRAHNSWQSGYLIGLVTLVYGVLLVMAAGCALAHADQAQSHHHHDEQGTSAQSVLCSWACHATADAAVAGGPPSTVVELVVECSNFAPNLPILPISSSTMRSRGPPLGFPRQARISTGQQLCFCMLMLIQA